MKKPGMEAEIKKAVREYVDSLIEERSKAGRGMAVGHNDLMAAVRAAPIKVYTEDLTKCYLKPALHLVSEVRRSAADNVKQVNQSYSKPARNISDVHPTEEAKADRHGGSYRKSSAGRQKKEPHWLTWRTGNTPSDRPESVVSRQGSLPAEILTIHDLDPRAESVAARMDSARRSYTPAARVNTPAGSVCNTPLPQRVDTPASLTADHRDLLADRQVAPADVVLKPKTPQNPRYMPALKAWITNANDYERDVAYNLMHVLSTGEPPIARHSTRPRTAVPGLTKMAPGPKRNLPRTAGVRTTIPAYWQQIYKDPRREQYIVNNMARALERKEPNLTLEPLDDTKPMMRYKYTMAPEYGLIHEGACFMDSQKPYRGSYVINPEWVSELKQSQKHPPQMACSGPKAMKYCSH